MNNTLTLFKERIVDNNPILRKTLGICSALAVTNSMENALVMSLGLIFVTSFAELVVSMLRYHTDKHIRMMVQVLIIAWLVIIVDIILKLYVPDISKALGPYVGLIITNCIIMGRCESFAQNNRPFRSFVDGITSGVAYSVILLIIAFFRELLGSGSLFGINVLGSKWNNWTAMSMPAGAFFMIGLLIWASNEYKKKKNIKEEN